MTARMGLIVSSAMAAGALSGLLYLQYIQNLDVQIKKTEREYDKATERADQSAEKAKQNELEAEEARAKAKAAEEAQKRALEEAEEARKQAQAAQEAEEKARQEAEEARKQTQAAQEAEEKARQEAEARRLQTEAEKARLKEEQARQQAEVEKARLDALQKEAEENPEEDGWGWFTWTLIAAAIVVIGAVLWSEWQKDDLVEQFPEGSFIPPKNVRSAWNIQKKNAWLAVYDPQTKQPIKSRAGRQVYVAASLVGNDPTKIESWRPYQTDAYDSGAQGTAERTYTTQFGTNVYGNYNDAPVVLQHLGTINESYALVPHGNPKDRHLEWIER